jgi:hypothetical protein
MKNEDTVKAINQEMTVDLLDDPELVQQMIKELQAVLDRKLGK